MNKKRITQLEAILFTQDSEYKRYALIEPARDPSIKKALMMADNQMTALLSTAYTDDLREIGPQLIALEKGSDISTWFLEHAYGKRWCSFIKTSLSQENLSFHLSHFTQITNPDGKSNLFSFCHPLFLYFWIQGLAKAGRSNQLFANNTVAFFIEDENPDIFRQLKWVDKQGEGVLNIPFHLKDEIKYQALNLHSAQDIIKNNTPWEMSLAEYNSLHDAVERLLIIRICEHLRTYFEVAKQENNDDLMKKTDDKIKQLREHSLTDEALIQVFCELEYLYPEAWKNNKKTVNNTINRESHCIEDNVTLCIDSLENIEKKLG